MELKAIYSKFLECTSVSTDTRKISNGYLFIALRGDNFNANTFAVEALEKGAKYVIIDQKEYYLDHKTILVDNCLETLQQLANYHRKMLKTTIIGLTGSNGKTTTKELINAVLSKKYKTVATIGNLNNHIGVPLTLLRLTNDTEIGIIEMGANHQKEIDFLCTISQPDYGYITNFGKAHLEGFGGVEGVIKGKSELFSYLKNQNKTAFINTDDPLQDSKSYDIDRYTFSNLKNDSDILIKVIDANPLVKVEFKNSEIQTNLIGIYNATNISAAIAIGNYFSVSDFDIKDAIEHYIPENNRSQILIKNSKKIILDAYNANPSSMNAALDNFFKIENGSKLAILGDMFELGNFSIEEHKKIVLMANLQKNITFYFVGNLFYESKIINSRLHFFNSMDDFSGFLKNKKIDSNLILIKGSRGMALERCLDFI